MAEYLGKGQEMSNSRKRAEELLKQWKEHGDLPPDSTEKQEDFENGATDRDVTKRRLRVLYILLGFSVIILVVGIVLLLLHYC